MKNNYLPKGLKVNWLLVQKGKKGAPGGKSFAGIFYSA